MASQRMNWGPGTLDIRTLLTHTVWEFQPIDFFIHKWSLMVNDPSCSKNVGDRQVRRMTDSMSLGSQAPSLPFGLLLHFCVPSRSWSHCRTRGFSSPNLHTLHSIELQREKDSSIPLFIAQVEFGSRLKF